MQHDYKNDIDAAVVYIKFGHGKITGNDQDNDEVVLRLLDNFKNRKKMLTIRISRYAGTISIQESTVTSSFLVLESNREFSMDSVNKPDIMKEMEKDYVGFWIMYRRRNVRNMIYEYSNRSMMLFRIVIL